MAVIFDAQTSAANGSGSTTLSWSHTLGALADTGLIVVVGEGSDVSSAADPVITGITYNGVAMTLVNSDQGSGGQNCFVAMYELHGTSVPVAGTYTVTITYAGNTDSRCGGAMSFSGVKNQVKEATTKVNANGTTSLSQSVTPLTTNAVIVAGYGNQNAGSTAFTTGETQAFNKAVGSAEDSLVLGGYKVIAVPSSTTTTVTNANPETEVLILASFAAEPDRGGDFSYFM